MTKSGFAVLALVALVLLATGTRGHAQVQPTLFNMSMTGGITGLEPWPSDCCNIQFAGVRLWDSAVPWSSLNPAPGVYDWSTLNIWINHAQQNGADILYTFGQVPAWASSKPDDLYCADQAGSCDPPNDLNKNGTGPNEHWKSFVSAIARHSAGRIHYWEVWDEAPNAGNPKQQGVGRWKGTVAQMVRMAKDARTIIKAIDPTAVITTPSGALIPQARSWFNTYFAQGGGKYADVINVHGYVQSVGKALPAPEGLASLIKPFRTLLTKYHLSSLPLWDTEASWGVASATGLTDPDEQAGFVSRFYLMHQVLGFKRFYWYEWDNPAAGTLWTYNLQANLAVVNGATNDAVSELSGFGDGTFLPPTSYSVGNAPTSVAVGDFNDDGIPDLVVTDSGGNHLNVLLGNGDNSFRNGGMVTVGNGPTSVAVGDFNNDGCADLAAANGSDRTVSVLLGDCNNSFTLSATPSVGSSPASIALADLDQNGDLDIVVANAGSSSVSVLMGNGHGGFSTAASYGAGSNPVSVAIADFNGDATPDLVVANNLSSGTVTVLFGNGNGSFKTPGTSFSVGTNPVSVVAADFNEDQSMDVAVVNEGSHNVSVLIGNGSGNFQSAVNYDVGSTPVSLAVAQGYDNHDNVTDFNGDGCPDLAVANEVSNTVSVLLGHIKSGRCDGTFPSLLNSPAGNRPVALAVGYFNDYPGSHPGTLLKSGFAYSATYQWMVNNTMASSCSTQGTVWTCDFTGSNGYQAQAVWDTSQTCNLGVCTTSTFTVDPTYTQYQTIYGQVVPITGGTVPIGYQPIMLQNQSQLAVVNRTPF